MKKTHNNLKYFICHSFNDRGWGDPALSSAMYTHVDLSSEKDNDKLNEMSIVTWLEDRSWREDQTKFFYGLGHYRRWLDLSGIDKLDDSKAYVHFERQPMKLDQIWQIYHSQAYLDRFFMLLGNIDQTLLDDFKAWLASPEAAEKYCARNLFVLPRKAFCAWTDFMGKMAKITMAAVTMLNNDPIWGDRYQKRQPGFLCERLTAFWMAKKSNLELIDTPMEERHEFSPYQRTLRTCVVAVQRDEANLDEWAKWHLDVCGFTKIVLYNDQCSEHVFPESLDSRITQLPAASFDKLPTQFACYNHFLANYMTSFDIALFIDLDEYLVLHGKSIEEHVWETGQCLAQGFNWVYYGSKVVGDFPAASLAKRFKYRASHPDKHVKLMLDLRVMRLNLPKIKPFFVNPHCLHSLQCQCTVPAIDVFHREFCGPYNIVDFCPSEQPYVAHYYCKTKDEFAKKIARGRADCFEDSDQQYYRQEQHMWDEFDKCDRNDIYDDEIARALQ